LKSGGFSVKNTTKTRSTARLCRTRSQSKPAQGKCPRHQHEHNCEAQYDVGIMLTLNMCWDLTILLSRLSVHTSSSVAPEPCRIRCRQICIQTHYQGGVASATYQARVV
jgi:hypothetical protein